jgi:hypothetical protein
VIRSGGIPILLSVLSYPTQLKNSLLLLLPNHSDRDVDLSASTTATAKAPLSSPKYDANVKKHILHEQLWLNCSVILHNLSFSHMAKRVMHLLSATDGFPIMCNCLRLCRDKIVALSSSSTSSASDATKKPSPASNIFRRIALARTSTTITQVLFCLSLCLTLSKTRSS